jgi:hypothetical protein
MANSREGAFSLKNVTLPPMFFVSVASKGLDGGRLQLKTGKTRRLPVTVDSK